MGGPVVVEPRSETVGAARVAVKKAASVTSDRRMVSEDDIGLYMAWLVRGSYVIAFDSAFLPCKVWFSNLVLMLGQSVEAGHINRLAEDTDP